MIFHVEVPIYRTGIVFIMGSDRKEAEEWLAGKGWLGEGAFDDELMGYVFDDEHEGITASKDDGKRLVVHIGDPKNHRTIAHETYHAVMKLMEWAGMYPSPANEEAFAYLVGYLTEEVYSKIKGHGKETT